MKQILKDLNNPYDIQSFVNLLNLLVNSSTRGDFYSKIVTFYQDRSMEGKGGYAKRVSDEFITSESMGHWQKIEYFSNFFTTEHRIYINSSLESTRLLVEMFINECMNQNIPFELKYAIEANDRTDGIVIGANTRVYKMHIDILRKIAKENPYLISECGTPHLLTSRLDGWMGLADENVSNRYKSYTQSRIGLILSACTKYLLNHPEFKDEVDGWEKMYNNYTSRYRSAENMADFRIEKGKLTISQREQFVKEKINKELANIYSESEFRVKYADLCKVINRNPQEAINEIYKYFLENCQVFGINPYMPTQYDTSASDLLQVKENETTITKSDLEDKTYNDLIAEYFSAQNGELSIQDSITVLRALDERMLSEVQLMGNSLMDVFLLSNGADDVKYLSNELYSVLRHCKIADEELGAKLVNMCQIYMWKGKNSKKEEKFYSEILANRRGLDSKRLETIKEKNGLYFSNALEPLENYEKSLSILKSMLEKHNRISPDLRNMNLETKIDFLEFMVEHYDKIKEYFFEISTKLQSMSKDEIEGLAKMFYLEERSTDDAFRRRVGDRRIVAGLDSGIEISEEEQSKEEEWDGWF